MPATLPAPPATRPWRWADPLTPADATRLRRTMALEHFKWDPQVGDTSVLGACPLLLSRQAWREIASLAEALDRELLDAEGEILQRPELIDTLGLPRRITRLLKHTTHLASGPRATRYDFHHTTDGWRISEANSDVPGGYVEASAYTKLMASHYGLRSTGDPAAALARITQRSPGAGPVALVHATAYCDDAQVMHLMAREFADHGIETTICGPLDLPDPCAHVVRFFPAEWLPALGHERRWRRYFRDDHASHTNPATVIVSQSKRWALLWGRLETPVPTWHELCPPCHEIPPMGRPLDSSLVYKPSLGRVGEGVIMDMGRKPARGDRQADRTRRSLHLDRLRRTAGLPGRWLAQQRFRTHANQSHVCLGVYVIAGKAAGVYGRVATRDIIDHAAIDVAVLLDPANETEGHAPW